MSFIGSITTVRFSVGVHIEVLVDDNLMADGDNLSVKYKCTIVMWIRATCDRCPGWIARTLTSDYSILARLAGNKNVHSES